MIVCWWYKELILVQVMELNELIDIINIYNATPHSDSNNFIHYFNQLSYNFIAYRKF